MTKVVVICSGGIDSTTILYQQVKNGNQVSVISFNYGQKAQKELNCISRICSDLGVDHKIVDMKDVNRVLKSSLTTTGMDIPSTETQSDKKDSLSSTVVPNRNGIFLMIASGYAYSIGASIVYYGAHQSDYGTYPDCRPEFVESIKKTINVSLKSNIELYVPLMYKNKREVIEMASRLKVPFEDTWSCYNGGKNHCGKCSSCVERRESFKEANVRDVTIYEDDL